jgi:hypothetical protein
MNPMSNAFHWHEDAECDRSAACLCTQHQCKATIGTAENGSRKAGTPERRSRPCSAASIGTAAAKASSSTIDWMSTSVDESYPVFCFNYVSVAPGSNSHVISLAAAAVCNTQ